MTHLLNILDPLKVKLDKAAISVLLAYAKPKTVLEEGRIGVVELAIAAALQNAGKHITEEEVDIIAPKVIALSHKLMAVINEGQGLYAEIQAAAKSPV